MPDRQSDPDRAAGVACRRLNPDVFERTFAQHAAIGDTIQGHAAGHAQPLHAGFFVDVRSHLEHHFFGDHLDAARQIHLPLGDL